MITETPAVIETESAPVETVETPEVSLQERLNQATPEEYTNWERTGDIPPVKPKSTPPKEEAPAASKEPSAVEAGEKKPPTSTETAAATEAARPQKKRNGDARILQLLEENKRDREASATRIAELEARLPKAEPDVKTAPSTVPSGDRPKPQASDIDPATGKPKYKTMEEVWDAREVWNEERRTKADQERTRVEQERLLETELVKRLKPAYDKYPDFVSVTGNDNLMILKGSAVDLFLRDSDNPGELLYHLGKNPQILEGFYNYDSKTGQWSNKVNPARQFRELTTLENTLTAAPKPTPTIPKPSASTKPLPPPPTVLSANGAPSGDPVDEAVKKKSYADYEKAANAEEKKARRR